MGKKSAWAETLLVKPLPISIYLKTGLGNAVKTGYFRDDPRPPKYFTLEYIPNASCMKAENGRIRNKPLSRLLLVHNDIHPRNIKLVLPEGRVVFIYFGYASTRPGRRAVLPRGTPVYFGASWSPTLNVNAFQVPFGKIWN
ncbi:hypothetical protein K439DRAFT_63196 [Ramaria rubella]|nr:hypothetical protein K439DRAFT_63196 [Ramaria rubella]